MKNKIWIILKKELREVFRDKKSLAMMLVIPLMIPLLVLGMSALFDMNINVQPSTYNHIGFTYELSAREKELLQSLDIDYQEGSLTDIENDYQNGKLNLYVTKNSNNYYVNYNNEDDNEARAADLITTYLNQYKALLQQEYLAQKDIKPEAVLNIINIGYTLTETSNKSFFADYMTVYAFFFIIMAITVSATYPATDATAGEKERGTLETLMSFPVTSKDIIIGKLASVTLSSIITGVLSLILALISLKVANNHFTIYEDLQIVPSGEVIIFALVVIAIYSLFISSLCIAIASMQKSFKEAQSALTPLTFLSFFPSMVAFMTNMSSNVYLSLIPFLNFTLLFTEVNKGIINIPNILAMIGSSIVYCIIIIAIIIRQYKSEHLLF